jgi:aryl-alcohol dehydrogenase-like predicted oxidoreductase
MTRRLGADGPEVSALGLGADRDRDAVTISIRFGAQRDPRGRRLGYEARPAAVETALAPTLERLDTDHVDSASLRSSPASPRRPARLDPNVREVADGRGATVAHVAIAWVMSRARTSCRRPASATARRR